MIPSLHLSCTAVSRWVCHKADTIWTTKRSTLNPYFLLVVYFASDSVRFACISQSCKRLIV